MRFRSFLLRCYRALLQLYPENFKTQFAAEMLEIAEAARIDEWRLIVTDTSIGILRSWMQWFTDDATQAMDRNGYFRVEVGRLPLFRLLQGFLVSGVIIVGYVCWSPLFWHPVYVLRCH